LKPREILSEAQGYLVAPYAGAWIETERAKEDLEELAVAPYAGAWIETTLGIYGKSKREESLPTRERGLKPNPATWINQGRWVAPYAGAWIETRCLVRLCHMRYVAPYAGAWIETSRE